MNRRQFVRNAALAVAAASSGLPGRDAAAQPALETTRIRLVRVPAICVAPEYVAEELLRAEGFTDVQYVRRESSADKARTLAAGEADITLNFAGPLILSLDASNPIVVLAGIHVGCFELFALDSIRTLRDLKSKVVAVPATGSAEHVFLSSMLAYVGVDPRRDIRWINHSPAESVRLLTDGKDDGILAFPPLSQELRARKIGHVLVNSSTDRPWLQYFCCMVSANQEFVRKHPVAT